MVTLSLSFLAVTAVGIIATPGLAAAALLIVPLAILFAVWSVTLAAATTRRRSPGGPHDTRQRR
jgi:steroid 5-alpha reductase family enzyme